MRFIYILVILREMVIALTGADIIWRKSIFYYFVIISFYSIFLIYTQKSSTVLYAVVYYTWISFCRRFYLFCASCMYIVGKYVKWSSKKIKFTERVACKFGKRNKPRERIKRRSFFLKNIRIWELGFRRNFISEYFWYGSTINMWSKYLLFHCKTVLEDCIEFAKFRVVMFIW